MEGDYKVPTNREAYGTYFRLAWPCIVEALLLCMVNIVDTMMVGTLGEEAIAAVGITNQPKFILLATVFALNIGITSVIARRKGQEDQNAANSILKNVLFLSVGLGIVMAAIGIVFARPFMLFAGAESNYVDQAVVYFKILSVGIFFQIINLVINAAQRGVGNTKITMITNATANIINIIFNYLLINGKCGFPRLEVAGAAIATSFGQFVACTIAIIMLMNRNGYINIFRAWKEEFNLRILQPVFMVGSSALVEQLCLRVGFLLYAMIVAKLGTIAYATHLICMTLLNLSFSFADGIGAAASTLVGQQLGAKNIAKSKMYGKIGQRMALIVSTGLFLFYILGRNFLIGLYSEDTVVIAKGAQILIIMAFTTHIQTAQIVFNGCLRGAGDSRYVAKVSLISVTIVRPIMTYILCFILALGVNGAWIALLLDQIFRFTFAMKRFISGEWSEIKI